MFITYTNYNPHNCFLYNKNTWYNYKQKYYKTDRKQQNTDNKQLTDHSPLNVDGSTL